MTAYGSSSSGWNNKRSHDVPWLVCTVKFTPHENSDAPFKSKNPGLTLKPLISIIGFTILTSSVI